MQLRLLDAVTNFPMQSFCTHLFSRLATGSGEDSFICYFLGLLSNLVKGSYSSLLHPFYYIDHNFHRISMKNFKIYFATISMSTVNAFSHSCKPNIAMIGK